MRRIHSYNRTIGHEGPGRTSVRPLFVGKAPPAVLSVTAAIDCWPDILRLFGNAQDKSRVRSKRTLQLKLYQALELIFSWL